MQSTQTCVSAGCADNPVSRGMCRPHYMAARNNGTLDSYSKTPRLNESKEAEEDRAARIRKTEAERSARRLKAGAWVNAPHGSSSRYKKGGCRCEICRVAANLLSRERYARRREAGLSGVIGTVDCSCRTCGVSFKYKRVKKYCSNDCYLLAIGNAPLKSWWISTGGRLAIYHRDGWRCQLCGDPVDMCAEPSAPLAPALDHIVPRSRGGNDEPANLRLTHSLCNIKRGSAVDEYVAAPLVSIGH